MPLARQEKRRREKRFKREKGVKNEKDFVSASLAKETPTGENRGRSISTVSKNRH